jgi:ATP-dependent DNA ligase
MLAQPVGDYSRITKEEWESGLYIQPKLDGVRCMIQYDENYGVKAYSRTGKPWLNIDHILMELYSFFIEYPNVVLDGELYNHELRDDFEKIISLVRKTKPSLEDRLDSEDLVQFHCYDFVHCSDEWDFAHRNNFLNDKFSHNAAMFPKIKTLTTFGVYNTEEVEVQHDLQKAAGYEGSILRKNASYECKRSWTLMKIKDFSDSEATIIGYDEGKGKRAGHLGKFIMRDDEGVEFGCPPGKGYNYKDLKNLLFRAPHYIGARATFTYFERTKKGSYRHPLFKSIRDYE